MVETSNQLMFFRISVVSRMPRFWDQLFPFFFGHPKRECRTKKGGGCPTAVESSYSAMGVVSFKYQIIGEVINPNKL
jgi:hypothetical protein